MGFEINLTTCICIYSGTDLNRSTLQKKLKSNVYSFNLINKFV